MLNRARAEGGTIVTNLTRFYGGYMLARFKDPFGNIWWLYEPERGKQHESEQGEPADVYLTMTNALISIIS